LTSFILVHDVAKSPDLTTFYVFRGPDETS